MPEIHAKDLTIGYYFDKDKSPIKVEAIWLNTQPYVIDYLHLKNGLREYYATQDDVDFMKIEILESQVWIPTDASLEMVEISEPFRGNVVSTIGCISRKRENYFIEDFLCLYYYDNTPDTLPRTIEYGANCRQCDSYNEYAQKEAGYTCWACKNGYNG